jgi:hypothetical protein
MFESRRHSAAQHPDQPHDDRNQRRSRRALSWGFGNERRVPLIDPALYNLNQAA